MPTKLQENNEESYNHLVVVESKKVYFSGENKDRDNDSCLTGITRIPKFPKLFDFGFLVILNAYIGQFESVVSSC